MSTTQFIARNGLIANSDSVVSGSLTVTNGITGSLQGTASYVSGSVFSSTNPALSASFASTASYALNAGAGSGFPFSGSAVITGSLLVSGSGITVTGSLNADNITGSLFGTASWATNSLTASYLNPLNQTVILTGSLALTQSYISKVDYIDFSLLTSSQVPVHSQGRVHWFDDTKTLQIDTDVNDFMIELGHQNVVRGRNVTGDTLRSGSVIYINGQSGNRPTFVTASYESDSTSAATVGILPQDINDNQTGYAITYGILRGINTTAYSAGQPLYLSSSGQFSSTKPQAPLHDVRLGKVITSAVDGTIYVNIQNGYELDEIHDVRITTASSGNLLVRSGSLWINTNQLTGSYGLTGSLNISGSITASLQGTASFASTASYALNGGVTQIVAGTNITITNGGSGSVTINSSGGSSGAGANVSASFANQSTWAFNHGLGVQGVIVQTYDTSWNQIIPQNITLTDANTATITFPTSESGYAIATLGGVTNNAATASYVTTLTQNLIVSGNIIPAGPYTTNTSSYDLGSATAAWRDLYVSNGSIKMISGSSTATIQYVSGSVTFTGAPVILPSSSLSPSASYAATASYVNALTQNVTINSGSLSVGYGVTATTTENSINVFPPSGSPVGEGGQIMLAAPGGAYTSASMLDNWQNNFRILKGYSTGQSTAQMLALDLQTGNLSVAGALSPSAWTAGQVIKDTMLSNTDVTISTTTIATSTSDTDFLTYSYTPVSSNSYLIIHYHLASYDFTGGSGLDTYFSRIKVDGAEITYAYQSTGATNNNAFRTGVLFPLTGRYTNSSTSAKSIVVAARRGSADDSITIANSATSMWLRITEIAR